VSSCVARKRSRRDPCGAAARARVELCSKRASVVRVNARSRPGDLSSIGGVGEELDEKRREIGLAPRMKRADGDRLRLRRGEEHRFAYSPRRKCWRGLADGVEHVLYERAPDGAHPRLRRTGRRVAIVAGVRRPRTTPREKPLTFGSRPCRTKSSSVGKRRPDPSPLNRRLRRRWLALQIAQRAVARARADLGVAHRTEADGAGTRERERPQILGERAGFVVRERVAATSRDAATIVSQLTMSRIRVHSDDRKRFASESGPRGFAHLRPMGHVPPVRSEGRSAPPSAIER